MAESYETLRERQQREFDKFPCFFAFNDAQFEEGMRKLGVASVNELYQGAVGMIYRKADAKKLHDMMARHDEEMRQAFGDDEFLFGAFLCELGNHEYCITFDQQDTLDALGIEAEEMDERMVKIFDKARHDYLAAAGF